MTRTGIDYTRSMAAILALILTLFLILTNTSLADSPLQTTKSTVQKLALPNSQMPTASNRLVNPSQLKSGSVKINVYSTTGVPITDATVTSTVNGQQIRQITNSQGIVYFNNIPVGQYSYAVTKAGYYTRQRTTFVNVNAGITTQSNVVLMPYSSSARVMVKEGITPVEGVTVSINANGINSQLTDKNGVVSFTGLPVKSYIFSASKPGYTSNKTTATVISNRENQIAIAVTSLVPKTGNLMVAVKEGTTPLEGAIVKVYVSTLQKTLPVVKTDQQGIAIFNNLPPGGGFVSVQKTGYLLATTGQTLSQPFEILPNQTTQTGIQMIKQTGSVQVTVSAETTLSRLAGAAVTLTGQNINKTLLTDYEGKVIFTGLINGSYQLKVVKETFRESKPYSATVAAPGTTTLYIRMLLIPKATFTVTDNGLPVSNAEVSLVPALGGEAQRKMTDLRGNAIFDNLEFLVYNLTVTKAGYSNFTSQLASLGSNSPIVTRQINLVKTARIELTVTDGVKPLPEAQVLMTGNASPFVTDSLGKVIFTNLSPGRYTFNASKPGYPSDSKFIDVASGEIKTLALTLPNYLVTSIVATPASFRIGQHNLSLSTTLDRATSQGAKVWLTSSNPSLVSVADSIWVPAGSSSTLTPLTVISPAAGAVMIAPLTVTLTAASGLDRTTSGAPAITTVTVTPIMLKSLGMLVQPVQPVYAGDTNGLDSALCGVSTDYPDSYAPIPVRISSAEPDVLNFTGIWESTPTPYLCTIPINMNSNTFKVRAITPAVRKTFVGEDRNVTIFADYLGQRLSATVPVLWPRSISSFIISPSNQYGTSSATITLDRPAPDNGLQVQIASSNRTAFMNLPNAVNFASKSTTATFAFSLKPNASSYTGITISVTTAPYWNSSVTSAVPLQ